MWVIFEGLDKSGKGTLEWELLRSTNFKHIMIDRGPVGYMVFDKIFNRETYDGTKEYCKQIEMINNSDDFMIVYCTVEKETAEERLTLHGENCPYDYIKAQKTYDDIIYKYYMLEKILELDTTSKSINECVKLIIEKLKEVQQSEL